MNKIFIAYTPTPCLWSLTRQGVLLIALYAFEEINLEVEIFKNVLEHITFRYFVKDVRLRQLRNCTLNLLLNDVQRLIEQSITHQLERNRGVQTASKGHACSSTLTFSLILTVIDFLHIFYSGILAVRVLILYCTVQDFTNLVSMNLQFEVIIALYCAKLRVDLYHYWRSCWPILPAVVTFWLTLEKNICITFFHIIWWFYTIKSSAAWN